MAIENRQRKRESDLDTVRAALLRFNTSAPIGSYRMDALFPGDTLAVHKARWFMKDAVMAALNRERHRTEFPKAMEAADVFFKALDAAKKAAQSFEAYELASVLALREPVDADGRPLDPSSEFEKVIDLTDDVMLAIVSSVDTYTTATWRPDFIDAERGNATIRFDHYLIEHVARGWQDLFGRAIGRTVEDRRQITSLVAASMHDFDYPAPPSDKLSDRIRHHRFWK